MRGKNRVFPDGICRPYPIRFNSDLTITEFGVSGENV